MADADFKKIKVNPFDDDIVTEPRDIPASVLGLNEAPLRALVDSFAELENDELPRHEIRASKAQLIISPDRGYGKSHLLGRLFKELDDRATLIYLRPFEDPQKCWHSILLQTVQELERTDNPGPESETNPRQIGAFANGVVSHLAADYIAQGDAVGYSTVAEAVQLLRKHPLEVFRITNESESWYAWIQGIFGSRKEFQKLGAKLKARIPKLQGREEAWLRVLYAYAFSSSDGAGKNIALKWIRGEPLEPEEVEEVQLAAADNQAKADMTPAETNVLSFERLAGLCRLAAFYRPFLFCFDQTEFYASDPALVKTLGNCIQKLFAEVPNQLTVVTANQENWTKDLSPKIEPPQRDRFSRPIELESIDVAQAKELIRNRLMAVGLDFRHVEDFYGDKWLTEIFETGRMSVRSLLQRSADRFRGFKGQPAAEPKKPKVRIEELFKTQVNLVRSKPALQAYSQDALMWFTQKLAEGVKGITVSKVSINKWFSTKWTLGDQSVFFAFEGGDNSQRWKVIAKEALAISKSDGAILMIVFRTPDLAPVPKPGWKAIGPTIQEARQAGLRIHPLEPNSVCEFHAARDLYSDALQGNVDEKPADILAWLKDYFADRIVALFQAKGSAEVKRTKEASQPTPVTAATEPVSAAQQMEILKFVEKRRWVSVDDVLKQLKLTTTVEMVLKSIEGTSIKAFPGPKTIVLQWRKAPSA
jgi:hypothetical protein